ncbi:MAG: NADH-quinone oxidoreductase subunit M [candidate division WOR-3 bacterium]
MSFPFLSIITFSPFFGAIIMLFLRKNELLVRIVAAIASGISLLLSILILFLYDVNKGSFQFIEYIPLVPSLGISYHLGVDGISITLVLLTAFIIFTGVFASWTIPFRIQEFYILLFVLVTGVFGVFVSLDLFIFFLFYELAVLPMYLLIGIWGKGADLKPKIPPKGIIGFIMRPIDTAMRSVSLGTKEYAAAKLTLYLLLGSAFILVGLLVVYFAGGKSFDYFVLYEATKSGLYSFSFQKILFLCFYIGFGVLAGVFPLHTWSPDGHAAAPTAVSMLHAGVLMKLGAYGALRIGFGLMPEGAKFWAPLVGFIACINIVYGALSAMNQMDLKYVVAYSSVSHMGFVMLGAATLSEPGLSGSVFQMFSHGIMTGLLFALVGLVYEKAHTRDALSMGGFGKKMPGIATAFGIGGLTSLGLPGLSGFVAEFLVFWGCLTIPKNFSHYKFGWIWFPLAITGTFITAVYVLRILKIVFFGPLDENKYRDLKDAEGPEWVSLWVLSLVLILFGVAPFLLVRYIDVGVLEFLTRFIK